MLISLVSFENELKDHKIVGIVSNPLNELNQQFLILECQFWVPVTGGSYCFGYCGNVKWSEFSIFFFRVTVMTSKYFS